MTTHHTSCLLYFAEVQRLPSNALRRFDILVDNVTWNSSQGYSPKYLSAKLVKRTVQGSSQHTVSLVATPDATLPPILNAFEIYTVLPMTELATNDGDGICFGTLALLEMLSASCIHLQPIVFIGLGTFSLQENRVHNFLH